MSGFLASLSQASLTRAVGLSVRLGSLRRTLEARRRSSSYATLKRWSSACLSLADEGTCAGSDPLPDRETLAFMTVLLSIARNAS